MKNEKIVEIELTMLLPNPYERRQQDVNIDSLAASMKASGLLYPIIVRRQENSLDHKLEIADGGRRVKAARALGWTIIKAMISDLTDDEMQVYATVANLQREGLSIWEEIAEVQYLVDRKTMTIAEIAEKLGKTISWVARRHRVSQAHPEIIAWVKKEYPNTAIDKICELCMIDSAALLQLIKSNNAWKLTQRIDELPLTKFKQVVSTYLMKLNAAPWKLDDETLLPSAGSCTTCPHRSGRNPGLFDKLEPSDKIKKDERCLNPVCWKDKQTAYTEIALVAARKKYPNLRVVSDHYDTTAERTFNLQQCKKEDKGAFPAFHIDDDKTGKIEYFRPWNHSSSSAPKPTKTMATMTEKERTAVRLATLAQKRARVFVQLVRQEIENLSTPPSVALLLLLTFGSDENSNDPRYNTDIWQDFTKLENNEVWENYMDATTTNRSLVTKRAWEMVKDVIKVRLFFNGTLDQIKPYYDDAVKFCQALNLDQNKFTEAAEKEIPTPKALQAEIDKTNKHLNPKKRLPTAANTAAPAKPQAKGKNKK